ncbi:2-oxo-4-hydroxy-4-carboxy-5-ureidoimidazoline decarboxylase [Paenibacillus sp. 7124]|uniref:2-oxo-4-hydroxy-4-carboxy-5-ureidoimidazoline decarboxylase n=1 Tax=Paenibacillus apii TaxID=1850370 RepID=A0A6M1PJH2_9BACL|nr:2-oxo-4-hydroxy-4-carboxy-5-ureidoimidazoline decarboxylase [Paenibacillus apii]NGM82512.1 2-oxo-4-hydroxy-4-carboxy-5-ureidoimidazoline decarboxylase [Paenibacillus apii]NJJ39652.1 2-oxo-4-hydroxy-4-carboxy-5-ureidoimidazoline decarboxylase [Paenibacillus apii]
MAIPASPLTLSKINGMNNEEFVETLGGIFEHSPWVAESAYACRPFGSVGELHDAMTEAVRSAGQEKTLSLLRAHPDLATRLQVTPLSAAEQKGAGLDRLTPEEFELLSVLNKKYTEKFQFPFILAVRGKNKDDIIQSISERVNLPAEEEWNRALFEIGKITRFRLDDLLME